MVYITIVISVADLGDYPNPDNSKLPYPRHMFSMHHEPIIVTPDTEYLRSVFAELVIPQEAIAFLPSLKDVADGLAKEYEDGVSFSLSSELPSPTTNWYVTVQCSRELQLSSFLWKICTSRDGAQGSFLW
jgi:hypothetical protein